MQEKTEKKRLAILRILHEDDRPHRSRQISEQMAALGHEVSERTVRFYLKNMDRAGLTENLGKRGRREADVLPGGDSVRLRWPS